MDDLVECSLDPINGSLVELLRQRIQGRNLQRGLDLVDSIAVLGLGDAQTVPRKGAVAVADSPSNVAVVVVVERKVPVSPVEGNPMGQKLNCAGRAGERFAVRGSNMVGVFNGFVLAVGQELNQKMPACMRGLRAGLILR